MFVVVLQVSFFQHFFDHLPYCAGSGPADKIFAIVPQCLRSFSTISQIFSIFFTIMVPSAVMLQFMITSSTPPTRCRGLGLMAVRWLRSRRAWVTASGGALAPGRRRSSPCHGLRPSSTGPVAMSQSRAPYHASGRGPSSSRP